MSQFRPRNLSRFAPRVRRASVNSAETSLRASMHQHPHVGFSGERPYASRPLLLSLLAAAALSLLAFVEPLHAQTTSVPHDVTLRFQTPDVANPHGGAVQSIWSATGSDGWAVHYDLTTSWFVDKTFGSFKTLKSPAVDMGLFTIPAIDYGEWGGGGRFFTKGTDTGLRFNAVATGGHVSVDYPIHVHLDAPKFIAPGASFLIHVTYQGDSAAQVNTFSPQAYASINLMLNAQLYLNGRVEIASRDLFNSDIIDWADRDDPQSPKYGQGGGNKGFHVNSELFNTNTLLNGGLSHFASYSYPPAPLPPSISASPNFPIIDTTGQPGSSSNYQSGAGGTTTSTSYEYTTGITTPTSVTSNPNATYARGQDNVINVTADFTNLLTNSLDDAGIPVPPLNFAFDMGPLSIAAGLLDLQANLGLGFLQEFGFVPKPKIRLVIGSGAVTTAEYEIDPINGVDIPVQMPALPPGADPAANVSVKVTPLVSMHNDFISNTYLNFNGGLSFRPIYINATSSTGSIGTFSFEPLNLQVGLEVPYPIYETTFEIPFAEKSGDAFYVTTQAPPLASLRSIYPSLLYVNENEYSGGYGVGVSSAQIYLFTDPAITPPNDFAGIWFGTLNSGTSSATALTYSTQAFWDDVRNANLLQPQQVGQTQTAAGWNLYNQLTQSWVDLSPGLHHIYASNTATTSGSSFGPRVTGLPLSVAYPAPTLDVLGARCLVNTPGAVTEFLGSNGLVYKPFAPVGYGIPGLNKNAVGPILAGSPGFTLLAIDHTPFNDPNAPNDPNLVAPFGVGSFSRVKLDGKLLAPDIDPLYSNLARPFVSGKVPASMLSKSGYHTVRVSNPNSGGKGGDSNILVLHIVNPVPVVSDVDALQQNPVQGSNADLYSHNIVAGSSDTRIRITGSALIADTKIYWQNLSHPLAVQFVSNGQLFAVLPATLLTQPQANHTLLVVNPRSTLSGQPVDGGSVSASSLHLLAAKPHVTNIQAGGLDINALYLNNPNPTTLTIKGEHFWPAVTAAWNRQPIATAFVDEQTLTVTVPAALLSRAANALLTVRGTDYDGQQQTSDAYSVRVVYAPPVLARMSGQAAVSPSAMQAGKAPPTLAVTGGLFYPGSKVKIGGTDCVTAFVDSLHVTAVVPAGIAGTVGTYTVVVVNPTSPPDAGGPVGDGGSSSPLPFTVLKYAPQAQITVTAVMTRLDSNSVQAQITLKNTGFADTSQLTVQSVRLGSTTGTTTAPLPGGSLNIGQSQTMTAVFSSPAAATGTAATLKLTGTMQGASFSSSARVTIP